MPLFSSPLPVDNLGDKFKTRPSTPPTQGVIKSESHKFPRQKTPIKHGGQTNYTKLHHRRRQQFKVTHFLVEGFEVLIQSTAFGTHIGHPRGEAIQAIQGLRNRG